MTNPFNPIATGSLYQGGTKTRAFTVPTGMSQSYYTVDDTVAVEGVVEDIINSGTVVLNASAVSLQLFATATMVHITATADATASLELFASGTSLLTASLLTLATSTLAFMTATADATASLETLATSTLAFMTGAAANLASLQSYATATAGKTASLDNSVMNLNDEWESITVSGSAYPHPTYIILADTVTGEAKKIYIVGGTLTVSPA